MSIQIARHEADMDGRRWRPDYVIQHHLGVPIYDAGTIRRTYAQILGRMRRKVQGVWYLKDVHIVDASVAELMAVMKTCWPQGQLHIVLLSPTPEPALQWAAYIGCDTPNLVPTSATRTGLRQPLIANMPLATVVQLSHWICKQSLRGDVLVFARSAAHRDALCEAWRCCNLGVPVERVQTHLSFCNGGPRVLVGTPMLDYMLDTTMTNRVQHVIDFGRVYRLRQDTGNDWEEAYITPAMADGRMAAAQSAAPGVCLRLYPADGALPSDTLATHQLSHDLCRAQIMVRCGLRALDQFPVPLEAGNFPPSVARLMARLSVEIPVATILHRAPSLAVGIGIAALVGRHGGPFVQQSYEACKAQGRLPVGVMKHVKAWASCLGHSPRKIAKALCETTWDDVMPLVCKGYQNTVALAVGDRQQYIDVRTGDILKWRYASTSSGEGDVLVYTHRQENTILSCLPVPVSMVEARVQSTRVHSPLRLDNDVQIRAMQAWFETQKVVAWLVSPREVELACGTQVNLSHVVAEWTDTMRRKALDTPLVVPLAGRGDSTRKNMSMVFTAGLRFSDAVTTSDFLVMGCELEALTTPDLVFLHKTPGLWNQENGPSMILATRKEAEGMWDHVDNVFVRALGTSHQKFQPCQVVLRLVIKVYVGKSTGRAVVHGCADKAWMSRVDPAWQWEVHEDVDLVSLYTRKAVASTVFNIPEHMDEVDVAALLQVDPCHVTLERTVQLLTQLPCVTRFFRALDPDNVMKASRSLRFTEFSMEIEEANVAKTLRMIYDILPRTNEIVNQPLRVYWSLRTTMGSHPSALFARAPSATTTIHVNRHNFAKELALVNVGMASATREAAHRTPTLSWCPSLAAPWVTVALPHVESTGGALFRLYGSDEERTRNRQALRRMADEAPPPPPGKYGLCLICFEPAASYALAICGCRFCPSCLAQAFETKCMDTAFVGELQCPTCRERVCTEDLSFFLRPTALRMYAFRIAKFLSSRIPDVIRECPTKCGFFGRVRPSIHQQSLECRQCNSSWCVRCSDKVGTAVASHKGFCDKRWDSAYWKAFAEEAALAGARSCPQCGTYVVKDGGCSHVTCSAPNCQTHFCWKCVQAFSHVQASPPAQGVIQTIQEDVVCIKVEQDTWNTPCHTPAPKTVKYRAEFARSMLLENESFEPEARVWVYSYIYDHLDACACV